MIRFDAGLFCFSDDVCGAIFCIRLGVLDDRITLDQLLTFLSSQGQGPVGFFLRLGEQLWVKGMARLSLNSSSRRSIRCKISIGFLRYQQNLKIGSLAELRLLNKLEFVNTNFDLYFLSRRVGY